MVRFLLAVCLDSAECMSMSLCYHLMSLGAKEGDALNIRFVGRVEDAVSIFKEDSSLDVLLFQSGELCMSAGAMVDYMYKPFPLMTLVHPLGKIAWERVASGISSGSSLHPSLLGVEYNVPVATLKPSDDPDVLLANKCALTNFKTDRASLEELQTGQTKQPVAVYIKETATLTAKRGHTGCVAHRCFS